MDQHQLRESLHREMGSMNREVDDIREGLLVVSHLTDGMRDYFYSLQPEYVRATINIV